MLRSIKKSIAKGRAPLEIIQLLSETFFNISKNKRVALDKTIRTGAIMYHAIVD